ncbi:MAG: DUF3419 family protein [Bacilli bacterium]|nr:DUF3419 family protein [Bacilli bacterium]
MSKNDLLIAQKIMSDPYYNHNDKMFHKDSFIYMKSNELIKNYQKYLENREKVLSVIGSSDQILNMILGGTKELDVYDISRFPKYLLGLKLAGVSLLDRDEYVNFFYEGNKKGNVYDNIYDELRKNLDDRDKEFWDGLFNFYDWNEISNSSLFSNEVISPPYVKSQNKYLRKDYYKKLKGLITDVDINIYEGDILEIAKAFKTKYDLVYLSNIIKYLYENSHNLNDYKELMKDLKLTEDGIALTYLNGINSVVRDTFKRPNYKIDQFKDTRSGVLVYKKTKE